ncbi:hypothetical protein U1Q18_011801 [Sarracenia purpurea var. burkii]
MPSLVISSAFNTGSFHWVNVCNSSEKPLPALALAVGHRCFCPNLAKKTTVPENSSGDFPKHHICAESSNKNVPLLLDHLCASVFAGFRLRRFGNRLRNRLCNFQNQSLLAPATSQGTVWIAPLPNQSPHLLRVAHCRNHHHRLYRSSVPTPTESRLATGHRTRSPKTPFTRLLPE